MQVVCLARVKLFYNLTSSFALDRFAASTTALLFTQRQRRDNLDWVVERGRAIGHIRSTVFAHLRGTLQHAVNLDRAQKLSLSSSVSLPLPLHIEWKDARLSVQRRASTTP